MSDVAMVIQAITEGAEKVGQVVNTINAVGDAISSVKNAVGGIVSGIKNGISGITNRIKGNKSSKPTTAVMLGSGKSLGEMVKNSQKPTEIATVKTSTSPSSGILKDNTTVKSFVDTFKNSTSGSSSKKTTVAKKTNSTVSTQKKSDWRPVYNGYTNELKRI